MEKYVIKEMSTDLSAGICESTISPKLFNTKKEATEYIIGTIVPNIISDWLDGIDDEEESEKIKSNFDFSISDLTLYYQDWVEWEYEIYLVSDEI